MGSFSQPDKTATLTGSVSNTGWFTGQIVYSADEKYVIAGSITRRDSGSSAPGLSGDFRQIIAGVEYVVSFDTSTRSR